MLGCRWLSIAYCRQVAPRRPLRNRFTTHRSRGKNRLLVHSTARIPVYIRKQMGIRRVLILLTSTMQSLAYYYGSRQIHFSATDVDIPHFDAGPDEPVRKGYSTSPQNRNRTNRNQLVICLSFSQKNRNSLTWVLVALTVCFTYPVLYRVSAESRAGEWEL